MSNKKVLSQATRGLNKAKAPSKPRDIIYDPMGQWAHPGQPTRIPSSDITMQGVPYPVWAQPNVGQPQMMQPGQEYNFPEADYVDEYPQMKRGGYMKGLVPMPKPSKKGLASKAYSRNLDATNRLFTENTLFKKPKDRKRKVFDPNAKYYAEGGFIETELTDEEIQAYKDGGYIVEDISIPTLEYQKGGSSSDDPWKKIMKTTQKKIIESAKVKKDNSDWRRANDEAPNLNYQNTNQKAPVKKLSPEDKKRQENFDKNFGVEGKDDYTKYKDKVQENLKLWAGERDKYPDYDDGEWESAVEDLTTKEINKAFDNRPDNQIAPKMNKDAPKETVAEYRQAKQDWDKKNFLEKMGTSLAYDLGIVDRGNPYKEFLPAPVAGVPQMAHDMTGMGRSKLFIKGAKYLMPKVKQVTKNSKSFLKAFNQALDAPNAALVNATQQSNPLLQTVAKNLTLNNILKSKAVAAAALGTPALYDKFNTLKNKPTTENAANFLDQTVTTGMDIIPYTKIPASSQTVNKVLNRIQNPFWLSKSMQGLIDKEKQYIDNPLKTSKTFDAVNLLRNIPITKKIGGEPNSMETELTDAEIEQLRKQGYVIELI